MLVDDIVLFSFDKNNEQIFKSFSSRCCSIVFDCLTHSIILVNGKDAQDFYVLHEHQFEDGEFLWIVDDQQIFRNITVEV